MLWRRRLHFRQSAGLSSQSGTSADLQDEMARPWFSKRRANMAPRRDAAVLANRPTETPRARGDGSGRSRTAMARSGVRVSLM